MPCNHRIRVAIVNCTTMFRRTVVLVVSVSALSVMRVSLLQAADARTEAKAQVDFGIDVAQRGLWREAIYRWEKAVEIDPTYAAAFNDLAVAYEHKKDSSTRRARGPTRRRSKIEPNNSQIKQNYELFKEINDRAAPKERP